MSSYTVPLQFICRNCIRTINRSTQGPRGSFVVSQQRTLRTRASTARSTRRTNEPHSRRSAVEELEALSSTTNSVQAKPQLRPNPLPVQPSVSASHIRPSPIPKATPVRDPKQWDDYNWYWETLVPSRETKADADKWFTKAARPQFLRSVAYFRQFPESDVPEVAFVGRSNVGKSSLLNAIVNADIKQILARTSKTPGCTKTMNLYGVGPHDGVRVKKGKSGGHDRIVGIGGVLVVDLPGYGEGSLGEWGTEIMKYMTNRKQLRRVFVLIDASHGIKDNDRSLLASLRLSGVPHQVLLSKLDKVYIPDATKDITHFAKPKTVSNTLKPHGTVEKLHRTMDTIKSEIKPKHSGGALGELLAVSSEVLVDGKRLGVDAVRIAVLQAAGVKFESKKGKKRILNEA